MSKNVRIIGEIDAIIKKHGIQGGKIDSNRSLGDVHNAVLWLRQKKRTGGKWETYDKSISRVGTTAGVGLGAASACLGIGAAATATIVPVSIGCGVTSGIAGLTGGLVGAAANMSWIRKACKGVVKNIKGTKGKHREEAANLFLQGCTTYTNQGGRRKPLPTPKDQRGQISADILKLFVSDDYLRTLAREYEQGGIHRHHAVETVKEFFKSDY